MKKLLSLLLFFTSLAVVHVQAEDQYLCIDLSAGPNAKSYPLTYEAKLPDKVADPDAWNKARTVQLWLRNIPENCTFAMGSPATEIGRDSSEVQHTVTLSKTYYIGVFPVTQRQWELVMGTRPSYFNNDDCYEMRPVECVSYDMIRGTGNVWPNNAHAVSAGSFLAVLRDRTGLELDLPTEAQWECACRKTTDEFETGALSGKVNLDNEKEDAALENLARYGYNGGTAKSRGYDAKNGTNEVGSYAPNGYGLYDMNGNVWEWCLDWYGDFTAEVATDPAGPESNNDSKRVLRGGGWGYIAKCCRNASRYGAKNNAAFYDHGFRLVCNTDSGDTCNLTVNLKCSDDDSKLVSAAWTVNNKRYGTGEQANIPVGVCTITFGDFGGYQTPSEKTIRVFANTTLDITYEKLYDLKVTVEPSTAKWTVNGDEYESGKTVQVVNGKYEITFSEGIDGYAKHGAQTVTVKDDDLTVYSGYVPTSTADTYVMINLDDWSVTNLQEGPDVTKDDCRTTELWLRKVPCGTFQMGYPKSEKDRYDYEEAVTVELTKAFYIGVFEITQAQWKAVMGTDANPSFFTESADTRPVEQVSYDTVRGETIASTTFIGALMAKINSASRGVATYSIDLPTEAQWEYSCKLKTDGTCLDSALNSGEDLTSQLRCSNLALLGRYWYNGGKSYTATSDTTLGTAKVGSYAANSIGLYDMHGNVQEWCRDWYAERDDDDSTTKLTDPTGPATAPTESPRRVVRGGNWGDFAQYCSAHWRGSYYPSINYFGNGFRIVMTKAQGD